MTLKGGRLLSLIGAAIAVGGLAFVMIIAAALTAIVPFLACLCLPAAFVVLIYFNLRVRLMVQAIMLEGCGAIDSMKRSWSLVDKHMGRLLGLSLLVGLLTSLIPMGLNAIGLVALSTVSVPPQLVIALSGAMGPLIQVALQAVPEGAITLFYYDLRIRKEGFDLSYQAGAGVL